MVVILFHAGVNGFGGGYVGVDVFFVISGYLITGLILQESANGGFSLAGFYERRARRIFPALFLVILLSALPAWHLLDPEQLVEFGRSLVATSLFVSNYYFWQNAGYFAPRAEEEPLLHTWSLAVEEQFYLAFPFLLMALWRLHRNRLPWLFLGLTIVAFAMCEWASHVARSATFYWSPTRAWELFTGAFLASLRGAPGVRAFSPRGWPADLLAALGITAIVGAVLLFDRLQRHPSIWTAIPVAGTALAIFASESPTRVGRLLSFRPLVVIGLASYPAYLWHYPLFAFARALQFGDVTRPQLLAISALSFALALVTWRFFERPCRDRSFLTRRQVLGASAALIATTSAMGAFLAATGGHPSRADLSHLAADSFNFSPRKAECFDAPNTSPDSAFRSCTIGSGTPPDFVAFGDSHALSLLPALESVARDKGLRGALVSARGCLPLLESHVLNIPPLDRHVCANRNREVFGEVSSQRITTIVLAARWTSFTDGRVNDPDDIISAGTSADSPMSRQVSRETFVRALHRTVDAYRALGTRVVIVKQVPWQLRDARRLYFLAERLRVADLQPLLRRLSLPQDRHERFQSFVNGHIDSLAAAGRAIAVDPAEVLCRNKVCLLGDAATSYYYDDDHLSVPGSHRLAPLLGQALVTRP